MAEESRVGVAATPFDPALLPPFPLRRFRVEEYHRMIDTGLFDSDERVELLEGWISLPMTRKPPHDVALGLADESLRKVLPAGRHVRVQSALTTADSEPEPDLAVVRGSRRDYVERHPGPAETAMVVEVADTSLARDRQVKGRLYARAGIPWYWILNLEDRRLEVYSEPSRAGEQAAYGRRQDYGPGDAAPALVERAQVGAVPVEEVLP
ncbi:MAG: Uma2 family endonuclease [Planctomycetes bacterium]|nr:Uma2 family endonuclease [Planctomycetota bacterium]